ncbi:hypothetical protein ACFFQF_04550 [Haladaptatus pallidirubidus]|uniref:DUF7289 family protein n=1 Tax=Haladaptatus pallidirubidus TaxID=1008152 RepID=UPI0035EB317A
MRRAQSNVVSVALLLGTVMLSLAGLTASVGLVVDSNTATADATRVSTDMERALSPVESTGVHRGRISFSEGTLETAERAPNTGRIGRRANRSSRFTVLQKWQ